MNDVQSGTFGKQRMNTIFKFLRWNCSKRLDTAVPQVDGLTSWTQVRNSQMWIVRTIASADLQVGRPAKVAE